MAQIYNTIITYDVKEKQTEVKEKMISKGYMTSWTNEKGTKYYLPNTTIWKKDITTDIALADLQAVCTELKVKLLRAVATKASPWSAIPGEDFQ